MSDKTVGYAYPTQSWEYDVSGNVLQYQEIGMTLLDHFAGLAMQAMVNSDEYRRHGWGQENIASQSYDMAEAMLAERERRIRE